MAQQPVVEEVSGEAAPPAKSKKKLMIIVAVLALAVGGGGAWFFMGQKSAEHSSKKHGQEEGKEEADAAHEAGGDKDKEEEEKPAEGESAGEPVFVKLETFTLNLNPEEGEKYLQVDITLNPTSKEESALLEANMPQVRNRILMVLTNKKPSEISTTEGKQALIKELIEHLNAPYSAKAKKLKITGVFFTSFVIQ